MRLLAMLIVMMASTAVAEVRVEVDGTTLRVTGDENDNSIVLARDASGDLRIRSDDQVTAGNGVIQQNPHTTVMANVFAVKSLLIEGGAGDDALFVVMGEVLHFVPWVGIDSVTYDGQAGSDKLVIAHQGRAIVTYRDQRNGTANLGSGSITYRNLR